MGTMVRKLVATVALATVLVAGTAQAATSRDVSRYHKVSGNGYARVIMRGCNAEDALVTVKLASVDSGRIILKCSRNGY